MANYVRVSIHAVQLKKDVEEIIHKKVPPLTKNPQLRNALAREYGEAVTPFVPRSNEPGHHLQTFSVSDGRVMWTRPAREDDAKHGITKGEEIAKLLYTDGPIASKGNHARWHSRPAGGNEYGPHKPSNEWDKHVVPGTPEWSAFIEKAAPIVLDYIDKG